MISIRIDLPDEARDALQRDVGDVLELLDREDINGPEAAEWIRQAAEELGVRVEVEDDDAA
jgi:bifunctional DNA-binding transcriptional regulator/antitoxin component of YhaV-PrlF toxin-antitoxin module